MTTAAIRNIAIIAHVDHGKTTLVDKLLQQSGAFEAHQEIVDRIMDSNVLEKERGITISAKCTSLMWEGTKINIVDTPGHADFGGEVERILDMVDGVILLVDAAEGPMPQTKFVLTKALRLGLKPIVIVNKADRLDGRPNEAHNEVFDLFAALDASDEQLDFPMLFASAKEGWAIENMLEERKNLEPLFKLILDYVPAPKVDPTASFSMIVSLIHSDPYLGRMLTGRIASGTVKENMLVKVLSTSGEELFQGRPSKLLTFENVNRVAVKKAVAGDIISIAGLKDATVSNTLCDMEVNQPLQALPIDPPTLMMTFSVNDSPMAGLEGDKVTSRMVRDRLMQESEGNISIIVKETEDKNALEVAGRGELQLGVLVETMRREGFELSISRPRVVYQTSESGEKLEPIEELQVDVDGEFVGAVVEQMGMRKGEMMDMCPSGGGKTRLTFLVPTRGLIGYQSELLSQTRGTAVMSTIFHGYEPYKGSIEGRRNGVLISTDAGAAVAYALWKIEERGFMFIKPGTALYKGMIIGENRRPNDLEVNPIKGKQLTNIRASGKDDSIDLTPPRLMSLEQAMCYIQDDELIEVTPKNIRLRKRYLDPNERKRAARKSLS